MEKRKKLLSFAMLFFFVFNFVATTAFGTTLVETPSDEPVFLMDTDFNSAEGEILGFNEEGLAKLSHSKNLIFSLQNMVKIGDNAFQNIIIDKIEISSVQPLTIGKYAFQNTGVKSVSLSGVTSVEDFSFSSNRINEFSADNQLLSVGTSAFQNNELKSIAADNLKFIGNSAFRNNKIEEFTTNAETISDNAFSENNLKVMNLLNSNVSFNSTVFSQLNDGVKITVNSPSDTLLSSDNNIYLVNPVTVHINLKDTNGFLLKTIEMVKERAEIPFTYVLEDMEGFIKPYETLSVKSENTDVIYTQKEQETSSEIITQAETTSESIEEPVTESQFEIITEIQTESATKTQSKTTPTEIQPEIITETYTEPATERTTETATSSEYNGQFSVATENENTTKIPIASFETTKETTPETMNEDVSSVSEITIQAQPETSAETTAEIMVSSDNTGRIYPAENLNNNFTQNKPFNIMEGILSENIDGDIKIKSVYPKEGFDISGDGTAYGFEKGGYIVLYEAYDKTGQEVNFERQINIEEEILDESGLNGLQKEYLKKSENKKESKTMFRALAATENVSVDVVTYTNNETNKGIYKVGRDHFGYAVNLKASGAFLNESGYSIKIQLPEHTAMFSAKVSAGASFIKEEIVDKENHTVTIVLNTIAGGTDITFFLDAIYAEEETPMGYPGKVSVQLLKNGIPQGDAKSSSDVLASYDTSSSLKYISNLPDIIGNYETSYNGIAPGTEADVTYGFQLKLSQRYLSSVVITDTLPTYTGGVSAGSSETATYTAKFDPQKNPGWVLSSDGKTVTTIITPASGPYLLSTDLSRVKLVLSFPRAVQQELVFNRANIKHMVLNKEYNDIDYEVNTSTFFLVDVFTSDGVFGKNSIQKSYDLKQENMNDEFMWEIFYQPTAGRVGKNLKDFTTENITLRDFGLDRGQYATETIDSTGKEMEQLKYTSFKPNYDVEYRYTANGIEKKGTVKAGVKFDIPAADQLSIKEINFDFGTLRLPYTGKASVEIGTKFKAGNKDELNLNRFYYNSMSGTGNTTIDGVKYKLSGKISSLKKFAYDVVKIKLVKKSSQYDFDSQRNLQLKGLSSRSSPRSYYLISFTATVNGVEFNPNPNDKTANSLMWQYQAEVLDDSYVNNLRVVDLYPNAIPYNYIEPSIYTDDIEKYMVDSQVFYRYGHQTTSVSIGEYEMKRMGLPNYQLAYANGTLPEYIGESIKKEYPENWNITKEKIDSQYSKIELKLRKPVSVLNMVLPLNKKYKYLPKYSSEYLNKVKRYDNGAWGTPLIKFFNVSSNYDSYFLFPNIDVIGDNITDPETRTNPRNLYPVYPYVIWWEDMRFINPGAYVNSAYFDFDENSEVMINRDDPSFLKPQALEGNKPMYTDSASLVVQSPNEFIASQKIGHLNSNEWDTSLNTKPNEQFQYKLEIMNLSGSDRKNVEILDIFPYVGDKTLVSDSNGLRINRNSEFSNKFLGVRSAKLSTWNVSEGRYIETDVTNSLIKKYFHGEGPDNGTLDSWLLSNTPDNNAADVTGVLLGGEGLDVPNFAKLEIILDMQAPDYKLNTIYQHIHEKAYNIFARRDSNVQPEFLEVNMTYNEISDPLRSYEFKKINSATKLPLEGVEFSLAAGGIEYTAVSNKDGIIKFNNVPNSYPVVIKETRPLPGYYPLTDSIIINDADTLIPVVENEPVIPPGTLKVIKIDDDTKAILPGASMGLYEKTTGNLVKTVVSDNTGIADFGSLKAGNYYIGEITAPSGYVLSDEKMDITITDGQSLTFTFGNKKESGQIIIKKTSSDPQYLTGFNKPLKAYFELLDKNGNVLSKEVLDQITVLNEDTSYGPMKADYTYKGSARFKGFETDNKGNLILTDLEQGDYILREIKGPVNHKITVKDTLVKADMSGKVYTIENSKVFTEGNIILNKTDDTDGNPISGVKFGIFRKNTPETFCTEPYMVMPKFIPEAMFMQPGMVVPFGGGASGVARGIGACDLSYIYDNTLNMEFPDRFKVYIYQTAVFYPSPQDAENRTNPVTIKSGIYSGGGNMIMIPANSDGSGPQKQFFYPADEAMPAIADFVSEEGFTTGNYSLRDPVNGWQFFAVTDTDADGKINLKNLPEGNYRFVELNEKDGYIKDIIPRDSSVNSSTPTSSVIFKNKRAVVNITVNKIDSETSIPLSGASFAIYQGESIISQGITNNEGKLTFTDIPYGEYVIKEMKAPSGYILDTKDILIDTQNYTENAGFNGNIEIVIDNKPIPGTLELLKQDSVSGNNLEGVVFNILDKDKKVIKTGTTDADGRAKFEGLRLGTYYLQELETNPGYGLPIKLIEFSVTETNPDVTMTITNTLRTFPIVGSYSSVALTLFMSAAVISAIYLRRKKNI